jgi:2TM domain
MVSATEPRREQAIQRIKAQKIHIFYMNLLVYLIVNAALVVFVAAGWTQLIPPGFFWPIVSLVVWGAALAIWGYRVYRGNVYTEEQIQREMQMLP